jgi:ubiquinone/menaquinone biosynthesis C-methylase UbiE
MPFKIHLFKELLRGIKFSKDELILDIGCGNGLLTMLLGKRCKKVIGIDISEKAVTAAKRKSQYLKRRINSEIRCVKIENAEFENEYFDKIFSIYGVISLISNYVKVLNEAYRILKKDGQMIFSVDCLELIEDIKLLEKHKREHCVEKYFKKEELKTLLEEIGFNRIDIYPICKTDFAKKLFVKRINQELQCGYLGLILTYFLLEHKEKQCVNKNKGIFLIIKCYK